MTRLRGFGLFRDLPFGEPDEGSVREALGSAPADNERRIVDYLRAGLQYAVVPAVTFDVLSPEHRPLGPLRYLTDGEWLWRSDLAHYVERYHCRVSDEFIEHMKAHNWLPPADAEIDLNDLTFWTDTEDSFD